MTESERREPEQLELLDLERAPERDEIGSEADQYAQADELGDDEAGPDRGIAGEDMPA
jgi:hypothetical protein